MGTIIQHYLFNYKTINAPSDLDRLRLALQYITDDKLLEMLSKKRGKGRDDYPIVPVWNSILAGIIFQHKDIESLRRELQRNGELRDICGFDPLKGKDAVPTSSAYSRFFKLLLANKDKIDEMFYELVKEAGREFKKFGEAVAVDSKALKSGCKKDRDANHGRKEYIIEKTDGTTYNKITKWFGYKIHALIDVITELPIEFKITTASESDMNNLLPLIEKLKNNCPEIYKELKYVMADRGYDSEPNNRSLVMDYNVIPIIDIRNMWKEEKGKTRLLNEEKADNIVYDFRGDIFCQCIRTDEIRPLVNKGYETERMCRKYICPVKAYGIECECRKECEHYNKIVRVKIEEDMRLFPPIPRNSYKWERLYKKRTAIERVFSRLAGSYQIELRRISGKKKVELWTELSFIVMLTMAIGHAKEGRIGSIRSLIKTAA